MQRKRVARSCCLVPNGDFRTIAKYAKPPYNETLVSSSPAVLGPVAQESVVDSALLRSIFRPFKPAFLYTTCTQSSERATFLLITSGLLVQELRCVRVLDPIPTKPSCVVSFLGDSGLLTSARIDELRFVNLSSQATIRCASAASGPDSCAG